VGEIGSHDLGMEIPKTLDAGYKKWRPVVQIAGCDGFRRESRVQRRSKSRGQSKAAFHGPFVFQTAGLEDPEDVFNPFSKARLPAKGVRVTLGEMAERLPRFFGIPNPDASVGQTRAASSCGDDRHRAVSVA
jgi:hypothetical protein